METFIINCTVCPVGCQVNLTVQDLQITSINGAKCKRGNAYATAEITNPVRTLTSIVRINSSKSHMLPVKSEKPLPKKILLDCMSVIHTAKVLVPVRIGDVVIENILNTGINIVATKNVPL